MKKLYETPVVGGEHPFKNLLKRRYLLGTLLTLCLAAGAFWLFKPGSSPVVATTSNEETSTEVSSTEVEQILSSFWEQDYAIESAGEAGHYRSPNNGQQLDITYSPAGFSVQAEAASDWQAAYALRGLRVNNKNLKPARNPAVELNGSKMRQNHGDKFYVDYANSPQGMQQDFVVLDGPSKARFEVNLELSTNMEATLGGMREVEFYHPVTDELTLHYKDLNVYDANGKKLDAWMELKATDKADVYALNLVAEGDDLRYPVTIDPLTAAGESILGPSAGSEYGCSVAVCDLNGDGYDDVIIGEYTHNNRTGRVLIYNGSASGLPASPTQTINGDLPGGEFGFSVACGGNLAGITNSLLVGAPARDSFFVDPAGLDTIGYEIDEVSMDTLYPILEHYSGRSVGAVFVYISTGSGVDTSASTTRLLLGERDTMRFGFSLAGIGDYNGDGYDDFVVGAPNYSDTHTNQGIAYVFTGDTTNIVDQTPAWSETIAQEGALFGFSVDGGDIDNNGFGDVIVGAYGYKTGSDVNGRGRAVVFRSSGASFLPGQNYNGPHDGSRFGYSVAVIGDVNDDSVNDFAVGAPGYSVPDSITTNQGAVYVYHGVNSGIPVGVSMLISSNEPFSAFGSSVAGGGDFDGDGISDLIVGAPNFTGPEFDEGKAIAYYGSASGLDTTEGNYWFVDSDLDMALFGWQVVTGDINGDGVSDAVIGACGLTSAPGLESQGAVYAYFGIQDCGLPKYGDDPVFLSCPVNITVTGSRDTCGQFVDFILPLADADCTTPTVTLQSGFGPGELFPFGVTNVVYEASAGGNTATCTFTVTVEDDFPPSINCGMETVFVNISPDEDSVIVNYTAPTATDNSTLCGGTITPVLVSGPASGSYFQPGSTTVVYEATDAAGNTSSCNFKIIAIAGNGAQQDCNNVEIDATFKTILDADQTRRNLYETTLANLLFGQNFNIGPSLLFNILAGILNIEIPGWVQKILGVGGGGVSLAFININYGMTPGINADLGVYTQINGIDSAEVSLNYPVSVCVTKPEALLFGCRDTIEVATSSQVLPFADLKVDAGTYNRELGAFIEDLRFELKFFLSASACIGIPVFGECVGYSVKLASINLDILPAFGVNNPIIWEGMDFPIIALCDQAYNPNTGWASLLACGIDIYGPNLNDQPFLIQAIDAAFTGLTLGNDGVSYSSTADEITVGIPPVIADNAGVPIPEFDFTFGRLTQSDVGPTSIIGEKLRSVACEPNFTKFRVDLISFVDLVTFFVIPPGIPTSWGFGPFGLDIGDLNLILREKFESTFEFNPSIEFAAVNLGAPMAWSVRDPVTNMVKGTGFGSIVNPPNFLVGDIIQLVIPEEIPLDTLKTIVNNNVIDIDGTLTGTVKGRGFVDLELKLGQLRIASTEYTLICPPPFLSIPTGESTYQTANLPLPQPVQGNVPWILQPDTIPPTVVCQDITAYLDAWGMATVTPEMAFVSGFDLPLNGTGEVILVEIIPSQLTCDDYPGVDAMLITEDDNCNFDTCHLFITVLDTLKPDVTCQDITVALNENGVYHLEPDEIAIGVIDNCQWVYADITPPVMTCADVGVDSLMVTVTVEDIAGNTNSCEGIVTVIDTLPPLLACPYLLNYPVTREADQDLCTYTANSTEFAPELLADDCDPVITYVLSGATIGMGMNNVGGIAFNLGETLITYTATDASGNATSCSFTVIVIDTQAPQIVCPPSVTIGTNDDGADDYNCETEYTWMHPFPSDNCKIVSYEITYIDPDGTESTEDLLPAYQAFDLQETRVFDLGTTMITYDVVDTAGLTATCTFSVTVVDDEDPMIFCEQVIACNTYSLGNPAIITPNDVTVVTLDVANNISISDMNVSLAGAHGSLADLTMTLTSPAGTTITLFSGLCAGTSNYDLNFDDAAATGVGAAPCGPLGNGGSYQPQTALSAFDGQFSAGVWTLTVTNAFFGTCGSVDDFVLEICGNDVQANAVLVSVQADLGLCSFKMNDTIFDPPFTDNCDGATVAHNYIMGPFNNTLEGATFPVGQTTVIWTVTDAMGNAVSCTMIYEVLDTQAPVFTNCPRPDIIREAEPNICGAYVNFSLPLAVDNCGQVTVEQTDATGLGTGSVFPSGMSILEYLATDVSGNTTQCSLRIIVNDTQQPVLVCPQSVTQVTDHWVCEAVVNDIDPVQVADNCINNTAVVYQIEYPSGSGVIIESGVADASGNVFPLGTSTVTYRLTDQPVLLITEATHEIGILNGGMNPVPYTVLTNDDYLEITNLGPAAYNVSELVVERFGPGGLSESLVLPNGTIVLPGQTLVIHFGNGTDDPANLFFNVPCAADLGTGAQAAYVIGFKGRAIDVLAVNGYNPVGQAATALVTPADWNGTIPPMNGRGGVTRRFTYDNNAAFDWTVADVCMPINIGVLNPELETYTWNGATMALQSIAPNTKVCGFNVDIVDEELPYCGEFVENVFAGATNLNQPNSITGGTVFSSEIQVNNAFLVGDVDILDLTGQHSNMNDLTFKLTSPSGTQVVLFSGLCPGGADFDVNIDEDSAQVITLAPCNPLGNGGWYQPENTLKPFYGEPAQGTWTLEIADTTAANNGQLNNWNLRLFAIENYSQTDTILENDPGFCGAEFSWIHPRLIDNCCEGSIEVVYLTPSFIQVPEGGLIVGGSPVTEYFEVGETIVRYILTDGSGNVDSCEFIVTVLDVEDPVVVCPNDIIINLAGGECRQIVHYQPQLVTDNCFVTDTILDPPSGSFFEIGITEVTITVIDSSGNTAFCTFTIEVKEFEPTNNTLFCNDLVLVALDNTCESEITADMILEGGNYFCYENYEVVVMSQVTGFPIPTSPIVTIDYVGQYLTVKVFDPISGNECWGEIYIEDNAIPVFDCPEDVVVKCNESTEPSFTGMPELVSCEVSVEFTYNDWYTDYGNCSNPRGQIMRTWTVTDESGNSDTCIQLITIERILFADIVFPTSFDGVSNPVLSCVDVSNNPALTSPANTGSPSVNGLPLTGSPYCSVSVTFSDAVYPSCEGTYDIIRTWAVYDPCQPVMLGVNPFQYLQVIKVEDNVAPLLTCPANMTVSTDANFNCTATVGIPTAAVDDNCSSVTVITDAPTGTLPSNGGVITGVELGVYTIKYTATDACGNVSFCSFQLTVVDQTAPVAICKEVTQVDLSSDGVAYVQAAVFDNGSYDDCVLSHFEVRRMDGDCDGNFDDFGPSVKFCCSDELNNPIMVVFRAYDIYGNYNDCMVQVNVFDKLPPQTITCPAPATITCTDYLNSYAVAYSQGDFSVFDSFGQPVFFDNCDLNVDYNVVANLDQCAAGTVVRTWVATDNNPQTPSAICTQTITVQHVSDWVVQFPADITAQCTDGTLPDFGEPQIYFDDCELIAVSYEDQLFDVVPDACYKVVRTWSVINWCVYDQFGSNVYIEYPETQVFQDWNGDGQINTCTFKDGENNGPGPDGFIVYEQVIKVVDEEAPIFNVDDQVVCILSTTCQTDVFLPVPDVTDCSPNTSISITSNLPNGTGDQFVYLNVPIGVYDVTYAVSDNCGNISYQAITVTVEDCKKPTPYCVNGIVTVPMDPSGSVSIWASDLDAGSFDNCTAQPDLQLSFSADVNDTELVLTCDDLGQFEVELWVTDEAGNQDFCVTYVLLQDNLGTCNGGQPIVIIAGAIETETNVPVQGVAVDVNGGYSVDMTPADGTYEFDLPAGNDYTVTPMLDENPLNGVTTFDLVLIQRHILGVQLLDSPYKMIAADANNSGTITTFDLLSIRKVILFIDDNFQNNTSWRFVDMSYVFPNPTNPWAETFPEVVSFNNLATDQLNTNFIAVKIGDVNGSVQANSDADAEDRTTFGTLTLELPERTVRAGEQVLVPVRVSDMTLLGFQYSMCFDQAGLSLVDVLPGMMTPENIGTMLVEKGVLTASWNVSEPFYLPTNTELHTLVFKAKKDGKLSEWLCLSPAYTPAEGYNENEQLLDVQLSFNGLVVRTERFELYQNVPNPFQGSTLIGFYLPKAEEATLTISDAAGRVLYTHTAAFSQGYNELRLSQAQLPQTGVLTYELRSGDHKASKRMIRID